MPSLRWSQRALSDLPRLRAFLSPNNPDAARRAIRAVRQGAKLLTAHPTIGHLIPTGEFEDRSIPVMAGLVPAISGQFPAKPYESTNPPVGTIQGMAPSFRDWFVSFGDSGYIIRYHHDAVQRPVQCKFVGRGTLDPCVRADGMKQCIKQ